MPLDFDYKAARQAGYSDDDILDGLKQRGMLDFDLDAARKAGYSSTDIMSSLAGESSNQATPQARNAFAVANDTVIELANAIVGGLAAVGDFASPGNRASKAMKEFIKEGEEKQSDVTKASKKKFRDQLEKSETIKDDLSAVGGYIKENPLLTAAQAAGSFVGPGLAVKGATGAAGLAGATAKGSALAGRGAGVVTGAAMGGGDAAGDAYELAQQISDDVLMNNKEVQELLASGKTMQEVRDEIGTIAARKASVLPAIAGGLSGAFGAEKLLAGGVARAGAMGSIKAGLVEGAGEAVEEGLAQFEGRRAAQEFDPSIDPTKNVAAMAAMGGVMGFGSGAALNAITPSQQVSSSTETDIEQEATAPLMIENRPDPMIYFPDGSVGKQSEVEAYIAGLPEDQQMATRARLMGYAPQEMPKADISDIQQAGSVDEAIAATEAVIDSPSDIDIELKNRQIDEAFNQYRASQRQAEFDLAEQQRRDAEFAAAQEQQREQEVEQANIITEAQGFDAQEPTAMELAWKEAQERRARLLTPVSQREPIVEPGPASQALEPIQEVPNATESPAPVLPSVVDTSGSNLPTSDVGRTQQVGSTGIVEQSAGRPTDIGNVTAQPAINVSATDRSLVEQPALDRRVNTERRRVQDMTPDELRVSLLTNDLSGLPNKRAFEEHIQSTPTAKVMYGDLDGFKAINTKYGHDGADQILRGVGQIKSLLASKLGVTAYHRSGDEFLATSDDTAKLESYGQLLQQELASATFQITMPDGSVVEHNGVGLSYGTGQNTAAAEARAEQQKAERKAIRIDELGENVPSVQQGGQIDLDPAQGRDGNQSGSANQEVALSLIQSAKLSPVERINLRAALRTKNISPEDVIAELSQPDATAADPAQDSVQLPEPETKPLKSTAPKTSGLKSADVESAVAPLRKKWQGFDGLTVVQSLDELPANLRDQADESTEGLYDPASGKVHIISDNVKSPERAAWVAAHEVIGHGGFRKLKDQTVDSAVKLASANRFVKDLAQAIGKDRGTEIEIEEAIAELSAATETDDFTALENRYGVKVPESAKSGIRASVARVIQAVKRLFANLTGRSVDEVSDAEIRELISKQRKAVETPSKMRGEMDAVSEGFDKLPALASKAETTAETPKQSRAPSSQWTVSDASKVAGLDLDDLIYSMQDKQIDMKRVVNDIKKKVGEIEDRFNPYLQEELFHGRAAKGVKDFLDTELRPMLEEMRMRGVEMSDFEEYLWNRHAEERNKQIAEINEDMPDGGSGIKTADARKYLAGLSQTKTKAYESLAKRIDSINAKTRQILVDSGLEKQSTIDAWEGAYKHYVPLQREDVDTGGNGTGSGFSIRGSSVKRAVGSNKPVADIIANIAMQREKQIVRAEKNRVSNALLGLAKEAPNPDFWTVDTAPTERVVQTVGGKDQVVERIVPGFRNQDNVVLTRINGEDHYVIFNERNPRAKRMAMSIKNLDADQLGRVLSATSAVTRYFASINTQWNPIFGVINLIRDTQGALLNLSTTPIKGDEKKVLQYTHQALRGIYSDVRAKRDGKESDSEWARLYEEFQNVGGQTGYRNMFSNAEQRAEAIASEIKQLHRHPAIKAGGAIFRWLSDYNETMENGVRLAAYRAGKERGLTNEQAASVAKNLTVNFNRKGQVATQMGALYAFFNASVQGTARLAETLQGPTGKKIIYGGILLGAMQAALLAANFGDDEPPEFVRSRNLIIPLGDGKYFTLPMPLGFHVLPNIGRIPTEFVLSGFKNPTKRIADFVGLFADAFNPIGNAGISLQTISPTVVDPLAALAENRDWTGKPIAKQDFNPLSPSPGFTRAKDTATSWSKGIAYAMNYLSGGTDYKPGLISPTPDQLDYLIGQATGGVGREISKFEQTGTAMATGEELPVHKIPLLGRFYGDTTGQSAEGGKFYAAVKRLNEHEAEIKGLRSEGKSREALDYLRDNPEAQLVNVANRVERDVQKLRKQKRDAVEKDQTERVKMLEKLITMRMKVLNDRIKELDEKSR